MKHKLSSTAAVLALTVVPLAGCSQEGSAISDTISTSAACADLIEMSLSDLRDAQENLDSPDQVAQTFRKMAGDFEEKATGIDDEELKTGVEKYVAKVKDLAQVAESGETPDINVLVNANSDLADACN